MQIDIHSHFIPESYLDLLENKRMKAKLGVEKELRNGEEYLVHEQGYVYPLDKGFYDPEYRINEMKAKGIDMCALSVSPTVLHYWNDVETGVAISQLFNNAIAEWVKEYPENFVGMGTLPLQDVGASLKELERLSIELGMPSIMIGANVEGRYFDEAEFAPLFELAEQLDIFILFHPYYVGNKSGLEKYYLTNFIGNPLETTITISSLIFGGIIENYPALKLGFVHAGGYMPYQKGRFEHGYKVRPEPKQNIGKSPFNYFDNLYFDTITHYGPALEYLINSEGSDKVMLGSDYPFDMADFAPVDTVRNLEGISDEGKEKVLGLNAERLLKIKRV